MTFILSRSYCLGLLLAAAATGCSGASQSVPATTQPQASSKPEHAAAPWHYHPAQPLPFRASLDLPGTKRLFVGDGGERWLSSLKDGLAQAAPMLADEDLVGVAHPSDKLYAFIGARGSIFYAASPLGPFEQVLPVRPAPRVLVGAGPYIAGISQDGQVMLSTDAGLHFSTSRLQDAVPLDLAIAPDGRMMVLTAPEALWLSSKPGAPFVRAQAPSIGTSGLGLDANGHLQAKGLFQALVWDKLDKTELTLQEHVFTSAPLDLYAEVNPGPKAQALLDGRATLLGDKYFEAVRPDSDNDLWTLAQGDLTGYHLKTPIKETKECNQMLLSGYGQTLVAGCMGGGARRTGILFPPLKLFISADAGSSFTSQSASLVADEEATAMTVLPSGTLMVSGACKPGPKGLCSPSGPVRLARLSESKSLRFSSAEPSQIAPIVGRTTAVVISPDGSRLYTAGRTAPNAQHALFISDDDGQHFRSVPLDLLHANWAESEKKRQELLESIEAGPLSVDGSGQVAWQLTTTDGPLWLVFSPKGELRSARLLPKEKYQLVALGAQGLAVSEHQQELWQSLDGGEHFEKIAKLPTTALFADGNLSVYCTASGCVFGDTFTRAGWSSAEGGVFDRGPQPKSPPPSFRFRTPIVCEVQDSPAGEFPSPKTEITASYADKGPVGWASMVVDPRKASVQMVHGLLSPQPHVELVTLLKPASKPERVAFAARSQVEGAVAVRYEVEQAEDGRAKFGSPIKQAEVVWEDLFHGGVHHTTLKQVGELADDDVRPQGGGMPAEAQVANLSLSNGGLYLCLHASCKTAKAPVLYVSKSGNAEPVGQPIWPEASYAERDDSTDYSRVGTSDIAYRFGTAQSSMAYVLFDSDKQTFGAVGLLPLSVQRQGYLLDTRWTVHSTEPDGMALTVRRFDSADSFAWLLRWVAQSRTLEWRAIPTQAQLSDPPQACTATERKDTYRIVAPPIPGSRHPVLIRWHNGTGLWMQTNLQVLYGTEKKPCVTTMDAAPLMDRSSGYRALVSVDSPDKSWLFSPSGAGSVRWKTMHCRFDPATVAPPSNESTDNTTH